MKKILVYLCVGIALLCTGCKNSQAEKNTGVINEKALFEDVKNTDTSMLPRVDALVHKVDVDTIYGQILVPDGSYGDNRPCVIMHHGFAGFTRWDDVAHALCKAGCVVIIPHHRGAWGSEGEYSITNCIEDSVCLAEYAHSEEFINKYHTGSLFLFGHSMGGNTVLNAATKLPYLKGIIMVAPCDVVALSESMSSKELDDFLIDNGIEVLKTRGLDYIHKNITENATMRFDKNSEAIKNINVFIAGGKYDEVCPISICINPLWDKIKDDDKIRINKTYDTDHGLMGARAALTKDIAEFINKVQ